MAVTTQAYRERLRVDHYATTCSSTRTPPPFDETSHDLVPTEISAIMTRQLLVMVHAGAAVAGKTLAQRWDEQLLSLA